MATVVVTTLITTTCCLTVREHVVFAHQEAVHIQLIVNGLAGDHGPLVAEVVVEELGKEQDIKQSRRKMEEVVPAQVATTQIAIPEVVLVVIVVMTTNHHHNVNIGRILVTAVLLTTTTT